MENNIELTPEQQAKRDRLKVLMESVKKVDTATQEIKQPAIEQSQANTEAAEQSLSSELIEPKAEEQTIGQALQDAVTKSKRKTAKVADLEKAESKITELENEINRLCNVISDLNMKLKEQPIQGQDASVAIIDGQVRTVISDRASRLCIIGDTIEDIEMVWDSKKFAESNIRAFSLISEIDNHINALDKCAAELLYNITPQEKREEPVSSGDVR